MGMRWVRASKDTIWQTKPGRALGQLFRCRFQEGHHFLNLNPETAFQDVTSCLPLRRFYPVGKN
jgi:hypothetical protein